MQIMHAKIDFQALSDNVLKMHVQYVLYSIGMAVLRDKASLKSQKWKQLELWLDYFSPEAAKKRNWISTFEGEKKNMETLLYWYCNYLLLIFH